MVGFYFVGHENKINGEYLRFIAGSCSIKETENDLVFKTTKNRVVFDSGAALPTHSNNELNNNLHCTTFGHTHTYCLKLSRSL